MSSRINQQELAFFQSEGYLVVEDVIPSGILDNVAGELSQEIDRRARKLHDRGELSQLYDGEGFETRLAKISRETDKLAVSI